MLTRLLKSLLFSLPLLAVIYGVETRLDTQKNSYTLKRTVLEQASPDTKALVVGSSYAYFGINPGDFDVPALNMAIVDEDFSHDAALAVHSTARIPNIQLVLVCLGYFSMEYRLTNSSERWREPAYRRAFGIYDTEHITPLDRLQANWLSYYGPRAAAALFLDNNQQSSKMESNGWEPMFGTARDAEGNLIISPTGATKRLREQQSIMSPVNRAFNARKMQELCASLQARGIQVVFVMPPAYHTYTDQLNPDTYAAMQSLVAQAAAKYHITYRNYLKDPRFTQEDFFDNDHLNPNGAHKFSRILNTDIIRPMLTQR